MTVSFGLDVGSNSLGSAWIDHQTGEITVGLSIFPAGEQWHRISQLELTADQRMTNLIRGEKLFVPEHYE